MSENLLTVKQVSQKLNLAVSTINNRLSAGADLPPSIKIGGARRFPESLFEAWLNKKIATANGKNNLKKE